jgi:glycosyl transferase family 25
MSSSFQFLNNYFDKILVLTLPRLTGRIEYIKKTFDGLNYEFFYGIDKEQTSMESLKSQGLYNTEAYRKFYKRPAEIPLGMLCCSLGHINIYNYIIENNFSKTLILEDDAIPLMEELEKYPTIIKELPDDWELFYLGYEKNEQAGWKGNLNRFFLTPFPSHAKLKLNRKIFKNYYAAPLSPLIVKAGFHDCSHAYAVSLKGARKLKEYSTPVSFHPDNLLAYLNCSGILTGYNSRKKLFKQLSAFVHEMDSLTGK